ncbi:hypothetical protein DAPPUDRAFT_299887 [Daphnia pulex]|uniref:Uncharacterized protein n=1 Tax=Daphnia pulex TaxID=6669 RepID=E9FQU0_DAPPU|nr:hypothetical protein DAPPUDRAFT_299887 [Daphnia pulex]|eukprot:EFX90313.1 hypothetical protein DAPPUDRAFT_299887 [Daphnia pulex]
MLVRIPSLFLMCGRYIQRLHYNSVIPRIPVCLLPWLPTKQQIRRNRISVNAFFKQIIVLRRP